MRDLSCRVAEDPLPYYLRHYLELVDWTGRVVRDDKKGAIPKNLEPILEHLGLDESSWLEGIKLFGRPIFQAIGPADLMRQAAKANHRSWYPRHYSVPCRIWLNLNQITPTNNHYRPTVRVTFACNDSFSTD